MRQSPQLIIIPNEMTFHRLPHTSKQNGIVEQNNRTLVEMARCLLQAKDLSTRFWDEAIYYANYLLNQIPMKDVGQVTHVDKQSGNKKPYVSHLNRFGCVTWEHISDGCMKKLDAKSHACIMMGYSKESKSYQLFDPVKQHIIIQHNVLFDENTFGLDLLKTPFGPSYIDPFGIVEDIISTVPPMTTSISLLTSVPESTGSRSTLTEEITSLDHSS